MGFDISIPDGTWVETELEALQWVSHFLLHHKQVGGLGLDTETTGLDKNRDTVVVWSLSDYHNRICLPAKFLPLFKVPILENPEVNFDLTNAKFDAHMLANTGIDISKAGQWRDTIVQSWLLNENNQGRHGLKECIKDHFDRETPKFETIFGKIPRKTKANPVVLTVGEMIRAAFDDPERKLGAADYASLDAYNSTALRRYFDGLLKEQNLYEEFYSVEVPFTKVLWKMERRGITVDLAYLKGLQIPIEQEMLKLEKEFAKEAGRAINLNSPLQVRDFFINHLGRTTSKLTKGGAKGIKLPSTDSEVLEKWASEGDEWASKLLEFRDLAKTYGTYVVGPQRWMDYNKRIHTTLGQTSTVTGRLACVAAETILETNQGKFRISKIDLSKTPNLTIITHNLRKRPILRIFEKGIEEMFEVVLETGQKLTCTKNHRFLTPDGWKKLDELSEGSELFYIK